MSRRAIWWGATAALALGALSPAMARPQYLAAFKAHYNTTQGKPTLNAANCSMCHIGMPNQAMWNPFGQAVRASLAGARNVQERPRVIQALQAAESQRAPNGQTFAQNIQADRLPAAGGGQPAAGAPPRVRGTWVSAFNGMNMDGWTKYNEGNWVVQNGNLRYTGGGNGWLRYNRPLTNYSAVIVWRYTEPGTNNDSGIFLKAREGDMGRPWPNSPQLNMGPQQNFGNIGGINTTRARFDLIRPNDWNTYQITVDNGVATVAINGQVAWDMAVSDALGGRGYLGVQAENRPLEISQFWVLEHQ